MILLSISGSSFLVVRILISILSPNYLDHNS
jgi:hypothetical protein